MPITVETLVIPQLSVVREDVVFAIHPNGDMPGSKAALVDYVRPVIVSFIFILIVNSSIWRVGLIHITPMLQQLLI